MGAPRFLAAGLAALAGWSGATVLDHARQAVYDLPRWAVALGVIAALAALAGAAVLVRAGGWLGPAVAVGGALVVATVVVVPVVAVLLLVAGVVWMAGHEQARSDRRSLGAGLVIALALPGAALVATDGPIVRCHAGGASTSSSLFRGTGASSGSGSGSATGAGAEGRLVQGGRTYTYRCAGDRLVRFTARPTTR